MSEQMPVRFSDPTIASIRLLSWWAFPGAILSQDNGVTFLNISANEERYARGKGAVLLQVSKSRHS